MIHLFKDVFLASDDDIDDCKNRIIISYKSTQQLLSKIGNNATGSLIDCYLDLDDVTKRHKTLQSFFDVVFSYENLVIYASQDDLIKVLILWLKSSLKSNDTYLYYLIKSLLYRNQVFSLSRFNNDSSRIDLYEKMNLEDFYDLYQQSEIIDISPIKEYLSVEYLLSSYLYDGSYKDQLKRTLVPLIKKDLQKYLYELKEIFLVHFLTKHFTDKLNLTKNYDFFDFYDIIKDKSPFPNLFMNKEIWMDKFHSLTRSPEGNICFENITNDDIKLFKEFTVIAGQSWCDESIYSYVKTDINKLDFLQVLDNFTDELLEKILMVESSFEHSAGSFFSIDLGYVNHYLIHALLSNRNNPEFLKQYSIK